MSFLAKSSLPRNPAIFYLFLRLVPRRRAGDPRKGSAVKLLQQQHPRHPSKRGTAKPAPRIAQPEAGGSAITLETSEPLFYIAVALNACGYDSDLAASTPVRAKIREEINAAACSLCRRPHQPGRPLQLRPRPHLADGGLNLAQYISLAVYLSPPPELTPTVDETELPPDSTQVVNILPLLRTFAEDIHLHAIWIEHRPEYEELTARVHGPLTKMILNTNIYLRLPVSSYDGRRFLVLLEPMLAPSATNARIYANDYIVVASPSGKPLGSVHMDDIRHIYLHYEIEPLVYARAQAMERLQPLLKAVQDAPSSTSTRLKLCRSSPSASSRRSRLRRWTSASPSRRRPGSSVKQRVPISNATTPS